MRKVLKTWVLFVVVAGLVLAACGGDDDDDSNAESGATTTTVAGATGAITVSAAASLTEAFTQDRDRFPDGEPGRDGDLQLRLVRHARDADPAGRARPTRSPRRTRPTWTSSTSANLVDGTPVVFAKNKLVIVTKPGNPKNVKTLADLADLAVVSLCGDTVPCGKYAAQILSDRRRDDPRDQRHAWSGREGDARRGDDGRRRRGDRLRHRRARRPATRSTRSTIPDDAERDRDVPDRDADGEHEQGDVAARSSTT